MDPRTLRIVVVPHTHWDREWYRTHEQFRVRLVALVDELLDLLERDPAFRHFMLDGQTIVVDDYLEVRPNARARIEKLVREGRLAVGPWHVLPDEWLVSGEALIRNLRLGLAKAEALGGAMRVGYVPDQFGHVGQLPQLFASFGFPAAVLWRGVGADIDRTLFSWEGPDGTRIPVVYLMHGYGNAVNLPTEPAALAARIQSEAESLAKRSDVSTLLFMNGSDHERPTLSLPHALEAVRAQHLEGIDIGIGSLAEFVAKALAEAPATLPRHRGELRSGLRSPLLPGCASARVSQKLREVANDRLLTRYLEPLAAWLGALGGDADPETIAFAWRVALENHPHDSVCGCSIDAVHAQMETRYDRVAEIAGAQLERVTAALARHVAVPRAGYGQGAGAPILVWNPNAAGAAGVCAEIDALVPLSKSGAPRPFHLRRADGTRLPVAAELLRPAGARHAGVFERRGVLALLPGLRREFDGLYANGIDVERRGERVHARIRLGDTPDPHFDLENERRALQELLADASIRDVAVETWQPPRLRLRFVDQLPGHGLRAYRIAAGAAECADALVAAPLPSGGAFIENAAWRVEVDGRGRVTLDSKAHRVRIEDALVVVSEGDRGDEYNFDPVPSGVVVDRPERARVRFTRRGAAEGMLRIDATYRIPRELTPARDARSERRVALPVTLELRLCAGLDRIDVALSVDNTAQDQRLRLHCRAPFAPRRFEVESAFEVAERPIAPAPDSFGSPRPAEFPIGAVPQRSFATLVGAGGLALTVANRGVAEVEAVPEPNGQGALALTVLRAVGWLSRADLRLRPGPAGPGLATPGAQVPGPHRVEVSLRLHQQDDARRIAEAHGFAFPPLAFAGVEDGSGALTDGARLVAVDDPLVLVSAVEACTGGDAELRLVNASGDARSLRIGWGAPARSLRIVDLAGREASTASFSPDSTNAGPITLGPWQIVTLRAGVGPN
jgi:alpha-mannosidase